MRRRRCTVAQVRAAAFWILCASVALASDYYVSQLRLANVSFFACLALTFVGVPIFIGLAAGALMGRRYGCGVTAIVFFIGGSWLFPLISVADAARLVLFAVAAYLLARRLKVVIRRRGVKKI